MPAGTSPAQASLYIRKNVFQGRSKIFGATVTVPSGTGRGSTSGNIKGMFCIDRSSGNIFLCTATTGTGTWVQVGP